jgi:lipopolysaccharide biosynthesis protein
MVRARYHGGVVFGIQNLGRDVLPFLLWLGTAGTERYEYVLKFHSKKSEHLAGVAVFEPESGEAWRRKALDSLIGEPRNAAALLSKMDSQADVGIVAPAGLLYDQVAKVYANADLLASLCETFAAPGPVTGRFPAGTMFWARVAALAPLARAPARALNFEREAGQVDGTLHHSYERLFPWIAASRGFRTVDTTELLA